MNWMDYREQLGVGFNDKDKEQFFINTMMTVLKSSPFSVTSKEYINFCMETGIEAEISERLANYKLDVITDLELQKARSMPNFLSYCKILTI